MRRARSDHDARASNEGSSSMNPAQKALWFIESHLADALTLDEIAAIAGISRFPHGARVRRRDRIVGDALCACPAAQRGGACAGCRRARYPHAGAGCGLRLSRSIHPRVPRPFRGHARSGPRRRRASTTSSFRSRSSWIQPSPTIFRRRVLRPASRCSSPASASATILRERRRHSRPVAALSPVGRRYSRPDRAGGLRRLLQRRRRRKFRLHRRRRSVRLFRPAARILPQVRIPEQRYAVFTHRDHISTIRRTVNTIWNHWLPASGLKAADAPNFERYDENFDPLTGNGGLEIWVPVRE